MIVVTVDFNSDEALYMQLCNQIILGIATSQIQEGDTILAFFLQAAAMMNCWILCRRSWNRTHSNTLHTSRRK